jgi:pseudouridine-5'-phosphate glycosidase
MNTAYQSSFLNQQPLPLDYHPSVLAALKSGKPVVALESTIITHGMEYPQNEETALQVEQTIRENGSTPATIAIMHGRIKIGLSQAEITELALAKGNVRKCSRRDLAIALMKKEYGSTTVAATMILAHMAGIQVFVTGGIGGVHRGAEETFGKYFP